MKMHQDSIRKVVNFNLLVVFIMQEMDSLVHIKDLVRMIIQTFSQSTTPKTTRQNQLLEAAFVIYETIEAYKSTKATQPNSSVPFCLRYPTLEDVLQHSMKLDNQCEAMTNNQKMIVLLDVNNICVGIGLP
jgi:hypothetical protein